MVLFGRMSASIAGDRRYLDTLEVSWSAALQKVIITVSTSSPLGGMDSFGGGTNFNIERKVELDGLDPKRVLAEVKEILANKRWNFAHYGKPTKNMCWFGSENEEILGLSLAKVKKAMEGLAEGD